MTLHLLDAAVGTVADLFRQLAAAAGRVERDRREAYLAGAADIHDLERRVRELNRPRGFLPDR